MTFGKEGIAHKLMYLFMSNLFRENSLRLVSPSSAIKVSMVQTEAYYLSIDYVVMYRTVVQYSNQCFHCSSPCIYILRLLRSGNRYGSIILKYFSFLL